MSDLKYSFKESTCQECKDYKGCTYLQHMNKNANNEPCDYFKPKTKSYELKINSTKNTTLLKRDEDEVELPFAICNDMIQCLDASTLIKMLCDTYDAGFEAGAESREEEIEDLKDRVWEAQMGDNF